MARRKKPEEPTGVKRPWHEAREDPNAWFMPKIFGIGAGLPVRWQGWALLAAHIALIVGIATSGLSHSLKIMLVIVAALLPIPLYILKTHGGWKWRWGVK